VPASPIGMSTFTSVSLPFICINAHSSLRNGPLPGQSYELPLLGTVLQVEIPYPHRPQLLETSRFDLNAFKPETQV
jgi:hypothetical protein